MKAEIYFVGGVAFIKHPTVRLGNLRVWIKTSSSIMTSCSHCGAPAGQMCRSTTGANTGIKLTTGTHWVRRKAWFAGPRDHAGRAVFEYGRKLGGITELDEIVETDDEQQPVEAT